MAPDIFKLLMQGQAPAMDNSASQGLNQQALELMMQAQSQPQAQVVSKPNTESILLSLLPAALGAGTDYIGSLGKSYLQGQQNEMARIDRQSQLTANQLMAQAKALSGQAGDMQDLELAQFNQANQNVRNAQNNLRMNAITQANNQTRSGIAGMQEQGRSLRWKDTVEGKALSEIAKVQSKIVQDLIDSGQYNETARQATEATIKHFANGDPQKEAQLRARIPIYPDGFKSKNAQGIELRKASLDIQKLSAARQAWAQWLERNNRIGVVTTDDIPEAEDGRMAVAEAYKVSPESLPLPKVGKQWNLVMAENNLQMRQDEFNYRKTKDEEDRQDKADERAAKAKESKFEAFQKQRESEEKKLAERHEKVISRFDKLTKDAFDLEMDIIKQDDEDKKAAMGKVLAAMRLELDPNRQGSVGYMKALADKEKVLFDEGWNKKEEALMPGEVKPFSPDTSELYGSIGRPTDSKPTDLKPTDKSNKGKTLPAVNQPKAKKKATTRTPVQGPQQPKPLKGKVKTNGISFNPNPR